MLHPAARKLGRRQFSGKDGSRELPAWPSLVFFILSAAFSAPNPPEHQSSAAFTRVWDDSWSAKEKLEEHQQGVKWEQAEGGEGARLLHDSSPLAAGR